MQLVSHPDYSIPYPLNGADIARKLEGKYVDVTINGVIHFGNVDKDLLDSYSKAQLKTVELASGSTIETAEPRQHYSGAMIFDGAPNAAVAALAGLGNSSYQLMKRPVSEYFLKGLDSYFGQICSTFHDVRGIDFSQAADIASGLLHGRANFPLLNLPDLSSTEDKRLSFKLLSYITMVHRDQNQAYWIARILESALQYASFASLSHIGGALHTALPEILKRSYGITAKVYTQTNSDKELNAYYTFAQLLPLDLILNTQIAIQNNTIIVDYSPLLPAIMTNHSLLVDTLK